MKYVRAFALRAYNAARALAWFEIWGLLNFVAGLIAMAVVFIVPSLGKMLVMKLIAWALS